MLKKLRLSLIAFFVATGVFAQIIKGQVKLDKAFRPMIYLIEISDFQYGFSADDIVVSDSIKIGPTGYFESGKLKENTLYRLNVVPEGFGNGGLIQDGVKDNYAFIATGEHEGGVIYLTFEQVSLFRSYRAVSSVTDLNYLQQQIALLRDSKIPVLDVISRLGDKMDALNPNDTNTLNDFRMNAIDEIRKVNEKSNALLDTQMETFRNPLLISLGLIFKGLGYMEMQDDVKKYESILVSHSNMPLVKSVLNTIVADVDMSFLTEKTSLINGDSLIIADIKSDFVLLDFWAAWCVPCRQSIKTSLKSLKNQYKNIDLMVLGVNQDKKKESALKAINEDQNLNQQIWEGQNQRLYNLFKVTKLPTYVLINLKTKEWHFIEHPESVASYINAVQ
jgi:thiol-disulfide isomerase/thioredoxin